MRKNSHFSGQPLYGQVIKLLAKSKILQFSREKSGERYTKRFNCWIHLVVMLYAVIKRFDSLREIPTSLLAETRKLAHLGINFKIGRSTLADANKRRSDAIFESIYRDLYATYRHVLSSDSRSGKTPKWMKRLQIIDSTTITLFSNLLFKGVGRHPKSGKKKGGIKVHTVIHANEGVPSDIKFTSAATNDSFMLKPTALSRGDIMAMDRAYIDYEKFEHLTQRGVTYVTKMKKNLKYTILSDTIYQTPDGLMEVRIQNVEFVKQKKDGDTIHHKSRIITYVDVVNGSSRYFVTEIERSAFAVCANLTSVTIPNSVTVIGTDAFYSCDKLTSITIPSSVTSIGEGSLGLCERMTEITVENGNPNYSSENGVLFNADKTTLIQCPAGKKGSYTIPNSVNAIGSSAFSYCSSLTSVTIPTSVTAIELSTFYNCRSLATVTIPASVSKIGGSAFAKCENLKTIYDLNPTPQTVEADSFSGVPEDAVVYIPAGSFNKYFVAEGWTQFTDFREITSGIDDVLTDVDDDAPVDVYDLQGMSVLHNASAAELESLPAGIYIVRQGNNVRKIAVK